jgi:serine phosphatase RsbU (regulator of sigma subunit)
MHVEQIKSFFMNYLKLSLVFFMISVGMANAQNTEELKKQADQYRAAGDINSEIQVLNKLAYQLWEKEKLQDASVHFSRILDINTSLGNTNGQLVTIYNLGAVYHDNGQYEKALDIYERGIAIGKEHNRKKDLLANYINAATSLQELKKQKESNNYIDQALPIAKELNDLKSMRSCYRILAENHELMGNTNKTIEYFDLFNTYDRQIKKQQMDQVKEESAVEVHKAEEARRIKEIELKFTADTLKEVKELSKIQKMEIDLLNQQKQIDELQRRELEVKLEFRKKVFRITMIGLIMLLSLLAIISFQFIQKKKANKLLAKQNDKINLQNKQITDSINYAQTIQRAILPMEETINQHFNSFSLFRPKDIVSGDFYWYSNIEEGKKWIAAVVDCTGHGVPGAFMSMIGNTLLNSIINEQKIYQPSKILEMLNQETILALKQEKTENRDGMDLCLCLIEKKQGGKYKITYSGAKRPLLYFVQNKKGIEVLKADRLSIGGIKKHVEEVQFNNLEIELNEGDIIYLSTDGYIDQNGPDRKRYGSNRLMQDLQKIAESPMKTQKTILEENLVAYMAGEEQRDDITIVGIQL